MSGTNPIAMAVPTGTVIPVLIDLSTSIVARGKIIAAAKKGEPIPEGWALDKEGGKTTDAAKALEGAVLTMAGPKGYALALMVDILAGVLTGGGFACGVKSMYKDFTQPANVGHFLMAIKIDAFIPRDLFFERMQSLIRNIKSAKRREGTGEIHVPGERKARTRDDRVNRGITLDESTLRELQQIGSQYSIDFPPKRLPTAPLENP